MLFGMLEIPNMSANLLVFCFQLFEDLELSRVFIPCQHVQLMLTRLLRMSPNFLGRLRLKFIWFVSWEPDGLER